MLPAERPNAHLHRLDFVPQTSVGNITNITFLELVDYHFVDEDYKILALKNNPRPSLNDLIDNKTYPDIWLAANCFAKSAYSVVLADLGQTHLLNILVDELALEYYTAEFLRFLAKGGNEGNAIPGPAKEPYATLKSSTGELKIVDLVIFTKYLYQVPRVKSVASLVFSILVADLVLLQALWTVFTFVVTSFLTRKDPNGTRNTLSCILQIY